MNYTLRHTYNNTTVPFSWSPEVDISKLPSWHLKPHRSGLTHYGDGKMMNERRTDQNSPKTSPRGPRSPAYPRQDSTGTLKATITLGKNPSVIHTGPFYLMKEPPEPSELTGGINLMVHYNLEHSYNKFSGKKVKEELSAFLPTLPGYIDTPGMQDNSSLRSLIEKPPITGKELMPLTGAALTGFRLHPGPLPEQYRPASQVPQKKKHKHKKHKKDGGKEGPLQENQDNASDSGHDLHKKSKKAKKTDEEKEKKKRKKEKKKKKEKEKEEKAPQS